MYAPFTPVEFFDASFTPALSTLCGACELRTQFVLKSGKPRKAT
jgi:hypothetical protein